jgi:hypothetical protein
MKTFKNLRDELEEGTSASDRGEPQTPHTKKEYDALSPKDKKIVDARLKAARKQGMSRNPYESPRNYKKRKPKTRRGGVSKYGRGQTGPLPKNEETEISVNEVTAGELRKAAAARHPSHPLSTQNIKIAKKKEKEYKAMSPAQRKKENERTIAAIEAIKKKKKWS